MQDESNVNICRTVRAKQLQRNKNNCSETKQLQRNKNNCSETKTIAAKQNNRSETKQSQRNKTIAAKQNNRSETKQSQRNKTTAAENSESFARAAGEGVDTRWNVNISGSRKHAVQGAAVASKGALPRTISK
jgi:hypothetical protein